MMSKIPWIRTRIVPTISSLLLGVSMWGSVAAQELTYSGLALYVENCSACHGLLGGGDGPVAGILAVPVPDLRRITERGGGVFPRDRVYGVIDGRKLETLAHGDRYMPIWGKAFWLEAGADEQAEEDVRQRIDALTEFLESIQVSEPMPRDERD